VLHAGATLMVVIVASAATSSSRRRSGSVSTSISAAVAMSERSMTGNRPRRVAVANV
jgi:hypothetical protein